MTNRTRFLIGIAGGALAGVLGVVAWLELRPLAAASADHTDARLVARGQQVYAEHCALCHGAQLEGQPEWWSPNDQGRLPAPPHDPSGHTWHHSDNRLFSIVRDGLGTDTPTDMPLFTGVLSDVEIWAVLAFIKSTWPPDVRVKQPPNRSPAPVPQGAPRAAK